MTRKFSAVVHFANALMKSGRLRDRVTVQLVDPSAVDALGQPVDSPTDLGTFWANVRELQGREAVAARQVKATLTHGVTLRYVGLDIEPGTHQLKVVSGRSSGRILGITSIVDTDGKNHDFELLCEAIL